MEVLVPSQSLLEKLQLKEEKNLLIQGLPSTVEKQFVKISFSKNVTPLLKTRKIDFALVFAICHKQLADILKDVIPALHPEGKLWIAYPKVSSKIVSDLSRDCNWECISKHGLEAVNMITVDNIWSATKFKKLNNSFEKPIREDIVLAGLAMDKRTITTPSELEDLFHKHRPAKDFFETLPYSNKSEYITWIASAKKTETKSARLEATIDKLTFGKKSPSEK
jgi:hypothetical protein